LAVPLWHAMATSANCSHATIETSTPKDKGHVLLAQGARRYVSHGMGFAE